jgi:NAD(P)-dependent dehydrogenase (short-subunit alcohol dehydrogenase family)
VRHARGWLRGANRRHGVDQRGDDPDVQPVAVITGGSGGIGEAIARRLAERGWRCVLLARRREALARLAAQLDAEFEVCDVADRGQVERAAAAVRERHPAVKLLVNNAGIPGRRSFAELEPERIEQVLRVNYLGSVWCLRAFLPALEQARPADVVNIVSVAGTVAFPPSGPYSASKHAQLAFSRAAAAELRPRGIRVHTVNPGFIHTPGFPNRDVLRNPLLRRLVVGPERVAEQVLSALEHDRTETFVPGWYRVAAIVQALAPGPLARLLARAGYRR